VNTMDYLNYRVEDFISDESFQRYCLGKDDEDVRFWKKWKEEHPQKQYEMEEAELFIHSLQTDEVKQNNFDYIVRKQVIRERLKEKIDLRNKQRSIKKNTWFLLAASVTFFICVLAAIVYNQGIGADAGELEVKYTEKINQPGIRSIIQLSDGTRIHLNSSSRLRYPDTFSELTAREVELEGEAFFEVQRDESKPFVVHSGNLKTTVLGTSFNIRAYHNLPSSVALVTGKVTVSKEIADAGAQEIVLEPGQGATLSLKEGKLSTFEFDNKEFLSWKEGVLYFHNANERTVVEKLERWYGVSVLLLNSPHKKWGYTGEFKNKSLKEVLMSMSFAMDFDYTIKGDSVLIN